MLFFYCVGNVRLRHDIQVGVKYVGAEGLCPLYVRSIRNVPHKALSAF